MYMSRGNTVLRNSNLTQIPTGSNDSTIVNWAVLLSNPNTNSNASALAVSQANPSNRLYAAFSTTTPSAPTVLGRMDNANGNTPSVSNITGAEFPQSGWISGVAVDPTNGNNVLVVFSNYNVVSLFYSADGGANWSNVEGNLAGNNGPSCRAAVLVPDGGGTTCYLGTSVGLYSTTAFKGAQTVWVQEGSSTIGNVVVTSLDARPSDNFIVVGTHANGVYVNGGNSAGITGDAPRVPSEFVLQQNYPNPFNPSTVISFDIPEPAWVRLVIYDNLGRIVTTLMDDQRSAGHYDVPFNTRTLSSGTYFYQIAAGNHASTKKMLLVR